jgi:hypothetical protein
VTTRRLGTRTRKAVLLLHICASGAWLGMDLVLALLVATALGADDLAAASALGGIARFATWPLVTVALLTLLTGVLLWLGTKYGLVRYRWVAVKLVINVVLLVLVLLLLGPGSVRLADDARGFLAGDGAMPELGNLFMPPIVSTTAVLVAMTLSVFKPWGRTRRA